MHKQKIIILGALLAASFSSFAQTPPQPLAAPALTAGVPVSSSTTATYSGETFQKIKDSGKIVLGYRASAVPLSFVDANNRPIGYALDICHYMVERIKTRLDMSNIQVAYEEVTAANRIPAVVSGKVDIECGATTNNASRRKEVDFSIPYYVAGIRILTKTQSGITDLASLRAKKVVVGDKSSSIPLVEKLNKERDMKINLIVQKDYPSAFADVKNGVADAFILDDLLLFGERSKDPSPQDYTVVGDFLSVEPISVMIRKNDPSFKAFLDKEMIQLITSGKINVLYKKWFESPIPPRNQSLNIPQSALLKEVFRMPTAVVGN